MNRAALAPRARHSPRLDDVEAKIVCTSDGLRLHVEVLAPDRADAPTLLLANGLGGKLYAWEPFLERFAGRYRIVTWDYRGLFRSERPRRTKALSIPHHAADAIAILDAEGVERATLVGWSMGVQVSLETALEYPERVEGLILLNGTFGHAFQTGLQPLVRLPGFPLLLHGVVERLTRQPTRLADWVRAAARSEFHLALVGRLLARLFGDPRLEDMYRQYCEDVFGESFPIYLRLFQELDAHSVYHLLPEVRAPTLVVSGGLDWLTPARQSFAVARRIPDARHVHLRLGSHFALLEAPERVLSACEELLARKAPASLAEVGRP